MPVPVKRGLGLQAKVFFFRAFGPTHGGLKAALRPSRAAI